MVTLSWWYRFTLLAWRTKSHNWILGELVYQKASRGLWVRDCAQSGQLRQGQTIWACVSAVGFGKGGRLFLKLTWPGGWLFYPGQVFSITKGPNLLIGCEPVMAQTFKLRYGLVVRMNFRSFFFFNNCQMYLSPPQRLPLGIPIKISIIDKNRKRAGNDGKRETPPSHRAPRALFFFLPSLPTTQKPPHNTKRPLRRREAIHCSTSGDDSRKICGSLF